MRSTNRRTWQCSSALALSVFGVAGGGERRGRGSLGLLGSARIDPGSGHRHAPRRRRAGGDDRGRLPHGSGVRPPERSLPRTGAGRAARVLPAAGRGARLLRAPATGRRAPRPQVRLRSRAAAAIRGWPRARTSRRLRSRRPLGRRPRPRPSSPIRPLGRLARTRDDMSAGGRTSGGSPRRPPAHFFSGAHCLRARAPESPA